MKRSIYILIVVSLLLVTLTSCNLPIEIVQKEPDAVDMLAIEITLEPSITPPPTPRPTPSCLDLNPFGTPFEHWPSNFKITSPYPTFTWFYSGGTWDFDIDTLEDWAYICTPQSYSIILSSGPYFTDEITLNVPVDEMTVTADTGKLTMTWTSNVALEPLKTYRWFVVGHYDDLLIHDYRINFLHSLTWNYQSDYYKNVFRTNPECPSGGLSIPQLMEPAAGAVVRLFQPTFNWNIEGCMPLVFVIQVSRNPNLDSIAMGINYNVPADYSFSLQTNYPWLDMKLATYGGIPALPDCATYYWRVQGGNGDVTYTEREWGEWSGIQSFFVNSGTCPTPTPTRIPPTKTPTATSTPLVKSCGDYTNQDACERHSQCEWYIPPPTHPEPSICIDKP